MTKRNWNKTIVLGYAKPSCGQKDVGQFGPDAVANPLTVNASPDLRSLDQCLREAAIWLMILFLFMTVLPSCNAGEKMNVRFLKGVQLSPSTLISVPFKLYKNGSVQSLKVELGYAHGVRLGTSFAISVGSGADRRFLGLAKITEIGERHSLGRLPVNKRTEEVLTVFALGSSLDIWRNFYRDDSIMFYRKLQEKESNRWESMASETVKELSEDRRLQREYHLRRRSTTNLAGTRSGSLQDSPLSTAKIVKPELTPQRFPPTQITVVLNTEESSLSTIVDALRKSGGRLR